MMNKDIQKEKLELLKEAIKNTQTIISQIDSKANFLLAISLAIIGGVLTFTKEILDILTKNNHQEIFIFVFVFLFPSLIIIWNLVIIFKLVYYVINPRINPFKQILDVDSKYENNLFFPIPENDSFKFIETKKKLYDYTDADIENIYLVELLKLSYIRHQKSTNLSSIIFKDFSIVLILLGLFITLFLAIFTFLR